MANATVNIYEAKTQLSKLIDQAASGKDVIIGRGGRPVAKITQLTQPKRTIKFGVMKGKVKVTRDFDAPLPESILAEFEGR